MSSLRHTHYGRVTDNEDPQKRGRLKVTADTLAIGDTDWVEPIIGFATLFVPTPGTLVRLHLAGESSLDESDFEIMITAPDLRWEDCAPDERDIPEVLRENYPHRRGWATPAGHHLFFDDKSGTVEMAAASGARATLLASGNVELRGGARRVARKDDPTVADTNTDSAFFDWTTQLHDAIAGWVPVALDGGAALKVALAGWLAMSLPTSISGKITDGNPKVFTD